MSATLCRVLPNKREQWDLPDFRLQRTPQWEQGKTYDRIGINEQYDEVLGINVQKVVIPVTPGRNIPIVLETAARKFRLKQEGYDPASDLMQSVFGSADGD